MLVAAAWGWAPVDGEVLAYTAEWAGITAGSATATTEAAPGGWTTKLATRSAGWLAALYPVDDTVESMWSEASGSRRYVTHFREGRFIQDQTMEFVDGWARVVRRQLVEGAWVDSTNELRGEGLEDPLSAVLRLRRLPEAGTIRVFSGRRVVSVVVSAPVREVVDGVLSRRLELSTEREGVLQRRITAWFAEDVTAVLLRAEVATRAGAVTVRLTERRTP